MTAVDRERVCARPGRQTLCETVFEDFTESVCVWWQAQELEPANFRFRIDLAIAIDVFELVSPLLLSVDE